jgi:SAM-dependent methyltransferase
MEITRDPNATAEELWNYYMLEYSSKNFIVRRLLDNYYRDIRKVIGFLGSDARLLEIGCAAGESSRRILQFLSGQHFEVSEHDPRLVRKLQENGFPLKVIQESVYELYREDGSFDGVFFLEVMEHLRDPHQALRELFRVSRKYVIISVPHEPIWRLLNLLRGKYWGKFGNTPGHINHWSLPALKDLVSQYGKIIRAYLPPPWIILLAGVNSASRAK